MFGVRLQAESLLRQGALRLLGGVRHVGSLQQKQQKVAKRLAAPWQPKNKPPPSPESLELAKRILTSPEFLDQPGMLNLKKKEAIATFQRHPVDTGSSEVQVAVLSEKIRRLQEHFQVHKRDIHSRRGLNDLIQRRRKLLLYLERKDPVAYTRVVESYLIREGKGSSRATIRPETWSPPRNKEDVQFRPAHWLEFKKAASKTLAIKRG